MRIPRPTRPGASPLSDLNEHRTQQKHTPITLVSVKGGR
jgi:hypothetical protein